MSADYILNIACDVKTELGGMGAFSAMRIAHRRLCAVLDAIGDSDTNIAISDDNRQIEMVRNEPSGPINEVVTLRQLREDADPIPGILEHCKTCPANIRQSEFGCSATVNYPISAVGEAWLLRFLPETLDDLTKTALLTPEAIVKDTADKINQLRRQPGAFESEYEIFRHWRKLFRNDRIGSSTVLAASLFFGPLSPAHCIVLAMILGFYDPVEQRGTRELDAGEMGDISIVQLDMFLNYVAFAAHNSVELLIDA